MLNRRHFTLACVAVALTGCSTQESPAPTPTLEPAPSATPTELDGVSVQPFPTDHGTEGGPENAPASDADKADATAAAIATMTVWVQGKSLDEQTWRSQINETLTPIGQTALEAVWGYRVPDTSITGDPELVRADAGTAVVRVPCDTATYDVTVVRNDSTWKTSAVTPVEGAGA